MATQALTVVLKHASNPDIPGGYWSETLDPKKAQRVPVGSVEEAATVCRAYIERNSLGGGNWTGGQVLNGKKEVARIAYNGRIVPSGSVDGMMVVAKLQTALLAYRQLTQDEAFATRVGPDGRVQLVYVTYDAAGKSTVDERSDWLAVDEFLAHMEDISL